MTAIRYAVKPVHWRGDSRAALQGFPKAARISAGNELFRLQIGLEPKRWRPMRSIGPGVREIKITAQGEFRVVYVIETAEGPVVLHAFAKKTQLTSRHDIELSRQRLREFRRNCQGER